MGREFDPLHAHHRDSPKDGDPVKYIHIEEIEMIEEIQKFNPYHDSRGRFTTAGSAASFTYSPGKSKAHDNAIAREKERHAAATPAKNMDTFTANMSPMQKQKTINTLDKQYNYRGFGVKSEKMIVEAAISQGVNMERREAPKGKVSTLVNESRPKQFDFLLREGECRKNQYPDFVTGKLKTPLATYFHTKQTSDLPDKYKTVEYLMPTGRGVGFTMTKTAFDYHIHLGGKPNTGTKVLTP